MTNALDAASRKNQDILSIDPTERARQLWHEQIEIHAWAERNTEALQQHGREIAWTGLAGSEFERI